jgi:hypothetical protein
MLDRNKYSNFFKNYTDASLCQHNDLKMTVNSRSSIGVNVKLRETGKGAVKVDHK